MNNGSNKISTIKLIQRIIAPIITVGLLTFLICKFEPRKIAESMSQVNFWFLLGSFGIMVLIFLLKTLRWHYILKRMGVKIKWHKTLWLIFIGMFGAAITPSKVGDVIKAHYLSKWTGRSETDAFFSAILDRITDLAAVAVYSLIAIPFFFDPLGNVVKWAVFGGILIIAALAILMFNDKIVKLIVTLFAKMKKPKKKQESLKESEDEQSVKLSANRVIDKYYANLVFFSKTNYILIFSISFAIWLLLGLQASLLLVGMSSTTKLESVLLVMTGVVAIAAVVALIPISISGIGFREYTITLLAIYSLGILPEVALSVSFIQTLFNVFLPALIGGGLLIFLRRKRRKTKNS